MKILVSGSQGFVGRHLIERLKQLGFEVVGFDILSGQDIRDYDALKSASEACEVIVHLAAVDNDNPVEIMDTNIIGTLNVLNVLSESSIKKMIFMSSVDALGIFQGEDKPKYLPIDDAYPCHPTRPYSLSKYVNEQMCKYYHSLSGKPILCLRAPGIWSEQTYKDILSNRQERPSYEWSPYWEYGAFIDVRDLVSAIVLAIKTKFSGFFCHLISSDDVTSSGKTSKELVDFLHPGIKWMGDDSFSTNPYRTLLDTQPLKHLLDWNPEYSWKKYIG